MTKFNKANLRCTLRRRIDAIVQRYKLDRGKGYSQVASLSTPAQVAYGEMEACEVILRQIDGGWLDDATKFPEELSQEPTISGKPRRPGSRGRRKRRGTP